MMTLGDFRLEAREITALRQKGRRLDVRARLPWTELAALLVLPSPCRLSWTHHDDPEAGLGVRVIGLKARPALRREGEADVCVRLQFARPGSLAP